MRRTAGFYWRLIPILMLLVGTWIQACPQRDVRQPASVLKIGLSTIEVTFSGAAPDLSQDVLLAYVDEAATAVSHYYGVFPVDHAKVAITVVPDRRGVLGGTTWGNRGGFSALTRLRIGQHVTLEDLRRDWILTHELVHTALPSLPDDQHWLEEGIATYVEPIARYRLGFLTKEQVWSKCWTECLTESRRDSIKVLI